MRVIETARQVDLDYVQPDRQQSEVYGRRLAFGVGLIAMFLAFGVAWIDRWFGPQCDRTSISHYFLEPVAGTAFVMALTFVGAFMIAYRGENRVDGWVATAGGVGAFLLAFAPTDGLGCAEGQQLDLRPALVITVPDGFDREDRLARTEDGKHKRYPNYVASEQLVAWSESHPDTQLKIGTENTQNLHAAGTIVLLVALLYFVGIAFTREKPEDLETSKARAQKLTRNVIYRISLLAMVIGGVMIAAPGWIASIWMSKAIGAVAALLTLDFSGVDALVRPVYHGEMLALAAFGVSWMLKGRFFVWLNR